MQVQSPCDAEEPVIGSGEVNDVCEDTIQENVDTLDVCYMSISYYNQKLGSALFYPSNGHILLVEQMEDNEYESVAALILQTQPKHVIVNAKTESRLMAILKSGAEQRSDTKEEPSTANTSATNCQLSTSESLESEFIWRIDSRYELHILSHTLFAYENCKNRIHSLNFKNKTFADQNDKKIYLSSVIDFTDNNTFRALGALLRFLDNHLIDMQNQAIGTTVEVSSIIPYTLKQLVAIEKNSFESLQVFQQEKHPSVAKHGVSQKEGLSLFGLFNCCVSKIGSLYLRKIFLMPTQETTIILDRLNTVQFFTDARNLTLRNNLRQQLKHIKGVAALFGRLKSDAFTVNDLVTLQRNLRYAQKIKDTVGGHDNDLQIFQQIKETFDREMEDLLGVFFQVVDLDKSVKAQSFEVNAGVDEGLDQSKYVFGELPKLLHEVAKEELADYVSLERCNCVYLPQIGFLTSVPLKPEERLPHEMESKLQFLIKVGDSAYYRTPRTDQLNSMFGDIQSDITDRQMRIISQLKEFIWRRRHVFIGIVRCCAKLDALLAMSQTALEFNYVRPTMTIEDKIEIVEGRHPLIELMFKTFVANDFRSGGEFTKTKLISGPNACGKSVYLKQICLIVYMAHIGSFVPAMSATIPIVDRLFTRIQSPESVSMRLSTFLLDLKQMSTAIKYSSKRSLVVIDEFGKGTQPTDGLALMTASINHLMTREGGSPHLVVSSHFKSLPSLLTHRESVECLTFELMRSGNRIDYLYHLIDGHSEDSIASYVARITQIPEHIITKGTDICESIAKNNIIECFDIRESDARYNRFEEMVQQFLKLDISSLEVVLQFFETNNFQNFRCNSEE